MNDLLLKRKHHKGEKRNEKNTFSKVTAFLMAILVSVSLLAVFPETVQAADEAGVRAFVTRMYETCLNREPEIGLQTIS